MISLVIGNCARRGVAQATILKGISQSAAFSPNAIGSARFFSESLTAADAYKKSCYYEMDFTIAEDATVFEAVQKFSAYDVGALTTVDASGNISGVISERDYICKIALLGKTSRETKVKEISTKSANLFVSKPTDSIEVCMNKMLAKDVRHLPIMEDGGKCVGLLSVKDLVKSVVAEKEKQVEQLANFALGKGGHFKTE